MAKKKINNKKKHHKKIQGKVITKTKYDTQKNKTATNKNKGKGNQKKKSHKHHIIPLFFLFGVLLICGLGYNKEEIVSADGNNLFNLHEKIDIKGLEIVKELCKEEEYDIDNLEKYLTYLEKYNSPIYHTIVIVNNNLENIEYNGTMKDFIEHDDFVSTKFERYLDYYKKYNLSINKTIFAVNNDLDKDNIKLTNTVESFMKQKYFIKDNLDRYLKYYEKHKNLKLKEIITRINSNLDKTFYEDITKSDLSKGDLLIVNKYYYLKKDYVPKNLVNVSSKHGNGKLKEVAYTAFKKMYNAAAKEGLYLYISSPYRSYDYQKSLYDRYVSIDGVEEADRYSARAGHSEHQTGLAFDLGTANNHSISAFESSKEFQWVKKNAHKYGFILRYPYGKTYITGYIYEPWHYRYVGVDIATYIYKNNITYEEYYAYFIK